MYDSVESNIFSLNLLYIYIFALTGLILCCLCVAKPARVQLKQSFGLPSDGPGVPTSGAWPEAAANEGNGNGDVSTTCTLRTIFIFFPTCPLCTIVFFSKQEKGAKLMVCF